MTEKDYTPIIPGASPDNPVPTKQYDSAEEVHPNRQDYEEMRKAQRAMQYAEPKSFVDKVKVEEREKERIFFGGFWVAMVIQMVWLPASLSGLSRLISGRSLSVLDIYGVLVMIVFLAYIFTYGILSIYEALIRRREYKKAIEQQAKFL